MAYQYRGAAHENHGPGNPDAMWHAGVLAKEAQNLSVMICNVAMLMNVVHGKEATIAALNAAEKEYGVESE